MDVHSLLLCHLLFYIHKNVIFSKITYYLNILHFVFFGFLVSLGE